VLSIVFGNGKNYRMGQECIDYIIQKLQALLTPRRNLKSDQFLEADWKIKTAVKTPTNPVTAKATVGKRCVVSNFEI